MRRAGAVLVILLATVLGAVIAARTVADRRVEERLLALSRAGHAHARGEPCFDKACGPEAVQYLAEEARGHPGRLVSYLDDPRRGSPDGRRVKTVAGAFLLDGYGSSLLDADQLAAIGALGEPTLELQLKWDKFVAAWRAWKSGKGPLPQGPGKR